MVNCLDAEKKSWNNGHVCAGVDEVGRGCVAGPVVAAAVVFDSSHVPHVKIKDSKKMTPKSRDEMYNFILENASDFGIGLVPARIVDEIGIGEATKSAMILALENLSNNIEHVLIDGLGYKDFPYTSTAVVKGDSLVYSISSASIIAKVFRDKVVSGLDNVYEGYNFTSHKGYGTSEHFGIILKNGLTPEHRKTFLKEGKHYHTI